MRESSCTMGVYYSMFFFLVLSFPFPNWMEGERKILGIHCRLHGGSICISTIMPLRDCISWVVL